MSFYQLLFSRKLNGINRNLTWYWNLFAKYMRENVGTLLAKILKIKGNTIVWNQLAKYASMASVTACGLTCVNNNDGSFTITGTFNNNGDRNFYGFISIISAIKDHKYLIISSGSMMAGYVFGSATGQRDATKYVVTAGSTGNMETAIRLIDSKANNGQQVNEKIWINIIDLTQLNDPNITDYDSFIKYYPLPYYSYDSGSLLSFNGTGIKSVGFNQWDEEWEVGNISSTGVNYNDPDNIRSKNYCRMLPNTTYFLKIPSQFNFLLFDADKNVVRAFYPSGGLFTTESNVAYFRFATRTYGNTYNHDICINISDPTIDKHYKPYKSSTKSLPISTYFPDGMLSAGSVYDELTPTSYVKRVGMKVFDGTENWGKETLQSWSNTYYVVMGNEQYENWNVRKIYCKCDKFIATPYYIQDGGNTRKAGEVCLTGKGAYVEFFSDLGTVDEWKAYLQQNPVTLYYELVSPLENYGVVDLGSLTWEYISNGSGRFISTGIRTLVKKPSSNAQSGNIVCSKYPSASTNAIYSGTQGIGIRSADGYIWIHDANGGTDPSAFKTAMSGVYLYYEKTDPAVIDLDLSYEIEWGGTEQLLPENTSTPTTSPISATVEYPDGEHEDYYTYQEIEKNHLRLNRALSIMLGRNVIIENPQEPLNIIMRGE